MSRAFDRIVIVMLENALRSRVLANTYMNELRNKGVFLENSYGVTHSSQPNYIASIGGDTFGLYDDTPGYAQWIYETGPDIPPVTSIVDLLEQNGLTWKAYAEDLTDADKPLTPLQPTPPKAPGDAWDPVPPASAFPFARKHVPFLSFPSITNSAARLANIVEGKENFPKDLAADKLPNFSWYTPNLVNDGHSDSKLEKRIHPTKDESVNLDNIASFLKGFLGDDPVAKFPPRTLIVITFDEAYPYYDPYQVYTLLIGDHEKLKPGKTRAECYNHYSLLRTVEDNFALGTLQRNDAVAVPYWFLH